MKDDPARADVVVREIEVIPNGREQALVFNGRLENVVAHQLTFPAGSIPDASKILIRLYPSPLSQIVEGMDRFLQCQAAASSKLLRQPTPTCLRSNT